MSRQAEKAQSMLHRHLRSKTPNFNVGITKTAVSDQHLRLHPEECDDMAEARRFFQELLEELESKKFILDDPLLTDESAIRRTNRQANGVLRLLRRWEDRMAEMEAKATKRPFESLFKDQEFVFQFYGMARNLPEASSTETIKDDEEQDSMQTMPLEYYGLESAGRLLDSLESAAEEEHLKNHSVHSDWLCGGTPRTVFKLDSNTKGSAVFSKDNVPTQAQMETELVAFKRQVLRQKYLSQ